MYSVLRKTKDALWLLLFAYLCMWLLSWTFRSDQHSALFRTAGFLLALTFGGLALFGFVETFFERPEHFWGAIQLRLPFNAATLCRAGTKPMENARAQKRRDKARQPQKQQPPRTAPPPACRPAATAPRPVRKAPPPAAGEVTIRRSRRTHTNAPPPRLCLQHLHARPPAPAPAPFVPRPEPPTTSPGPTVDVEAMCVKLEAIRAELQGKLDANNQRGQDARGREGIWTDPARDRRTPKDVLFEIMYFLEPEEVKKCRQLSKHWNQLLQDFDVVVHSVILTGMKMPNCSWPKFARILQDPWKHFFEPVYGKYAPSSPNPEPDDSPILELGWEERCNPLPEDLVLHCVAHESKMDEWEQAIEASQHKIKRGITGSLHKLQELKNQLEKREESNEQQKERGEKDSALRLHEEFTNLVISLRFGLGLKERLAFAREKARQARERKRLSAIEDELKQIGKALIQGRKRKKRKGKATKNIQAAVEELRHGLAALESIRRQALPAKSVAASPLSPPPTSWIRS